MKNPDAYLKRLSDHAKENILKIGYDKPDKRKEAVLKILSTHGIIFEETPPGNDLYSHKFRTEQKENEINLYINYRHNLMTQSEYIINGRHRLYNRISPVSAYPYINKIAALEFVYVTKEFLFSQILFEEFEHSGRLAPLFCSVYFEDI